MKRVHLNNFEFVVEKLYKKKQHTLLIQLIARGFTANGRTSRLDDTPHASPRVLQTELSGHS